MGCLRLRKRPIGFLLGGVDEIRKLDGVLDEEDGDVVADEVPVAFFRIHLHSKAADVASQIGRSFVASNGREADEHRRFFTGALEEVGPGVGRKRPISLKETMRAVTASVNHTFRNTFVVEMKHLFAIMEVVQDQRAAGTDT